MRKRITAFVLTVALTATMLAGCGSTVDAEDTALKVNGVKLTADVAEFYARYIQAGYETKYMAYVGENMWSSHADEGDTYEEAVKAHIMQDLETMLLSELYMKEYKVSLSKAEKKVIEQSAKEFSEDNALHNKKLVSGDRKTVARVLTLMAIKKKVKEAIMEEAKEKVTDEEVRQKRMLYVYFPYIQQNETGKGQRLTKEERAQEKENAVMFAESLNQEDDFDTAAKNMDKICWEATFDANSKIPSRKLVKAADELSLNDVTDVIETRKGCYIAKVVSLKDKKATARKKKQLIERRKIRAYKTQKAKWLDEADIKVHGSVWRAISFKNLGVRIKQKEEKPYTDRLKTDDQVNTDLDY